MPVKKPLPPSKTVTTAAKKQLRAWYSEAAEVLKEASCQLAPSVGHAEGCHNAVMGLHARATLACRMQVRKHLGWIEVVALKASLPTCDYTVRWIVWSSDKPTGTPCRRATLCIDHPALKVHAAAGRQAAKELQLASANQHPHTSRHTCLPAPGCGNVATCTGRVCMCRANVNQHTSYLPA
jgi:hypothetical protein